MQHDHFRCPNCRDIRGDLPCLVCEDDPDTVGLPTTDAPDSDSADQRLEAA